VSAPVIDSSAALSWCFVDQTTPESDLLLERVRDQGAVVPGLWHVEVANVLLQGEKRGRISSGDVAMRLERGGISGVCNPPQPSTADQGWH
jgi:hypothetical protein